MGTEHGRGNTSSAFVGVVTNKDFSTIQFSASSLFTGTDHMLVTTPTWARNMGVENIALAFVGVVTNKDFSTIQFSASSLFTGPDHMLVIHQ